MSLCGLIYQARALMTGGMHGIEALMKMPLKFNLQWSKEQVWSHNEEFSRGKLRYKSMTTGTH
jgi:hypothetical protein